MPPIDTAVIVLAGIALLAASRQRRARLRLFIAHRAGRTRLLRQSHTQPGDRADRSLRQPVRSLHQPKRHSGGLEARVSDPHRIAAGHRARGLCSGFAAAGLDQVRDLPGHPAAYPGAGRRLAKAHASRDGLLACPSDRRWGCSTRSRPSPARRWRSCSTIRAWSKINSGPGSALVRVAESCLTAIVYYTARPVRRRKHRPVMGARSLRRHSASRSGRICCGGWMPRRSAGSA